MWRFLRRHRPQEGVDVELGAPPEPALRKPFINGFPSAAEFVASDPDHSFSIYRAFHQMTSRNLLYLEAELLELQKEQNDMDIEDFRSNPDRVQSLRSWKLTSNGVQQTPRMELVLKIRRTLKEYQKALILQEAVLKMEQPQPRTVEALKLWLDGKSEGPNGRFAPSFSGLSATRLDDESDLVALHPAFQKDWLAKLVQMPYLRMLCLDSHVDESIAFFSMEKFNRAAAMLNSVVATVLLIVSIVVLYVVSKPSVRLGLICFFTVLFALSVKTLTNARRAEVFASTAAYAAVLVVFVSGNLGSSSSTPAGG